MRHWQLQAWISCGAAFCAALLVTHPAMAELFLYHGKIGFNEYSQPVALCNIEGASVSFPWGAGGQAASIQLAGDGLRLGASASSIGTNSFNPEAYAAWRDVAFVSGTPPSTLRFDFQVHATLGLDGIPFIDAGGGFPGNGKLASLVMSFSSGNSVDQTPGFTAPVDSRLGIESGILPLEIMIGSGLTNLGLGTATGYAQDFRGNGWDPTTNITWNSDHTAIDLVGTFHGIVPYSPLYGGYVWGVSQDVFVNPGFFHPPGGTFRTTANSGAYADAMHTLR